MSVNAYAPITVLGLAPSPLTRLCTLFHSLAPPSSVVRRRDQERTVITRMPRTTMCIRTRMNRRHGAFIIPWWGWSLEVDQAERWMFSGAPIGSWTITMVLAPPM